MQTLNFLGRGSAFNIAEGNTSAYLLIDKTLYLFDCGFTVLPKIVELGLLSRVDKIVVAITHLHTDHVGSLGTLIEMCYYTLHKEITVVFNNKKVIKSYLRSICIEEGQYNLTDKYHDKDITIVPFATNHCSVICNDSQLGHLNTDDCKENIFPCYMFLIKLKDRKILYSGDSSDYGDEILELAATFECDEVYKDLCIADYEGNVHCNIDKFYTVCKQRAFDVNKIYAMHYDNTQMIEQKCKEYGFNIVKSI